MKTRMYYLSYPITIGDNLAYYAGITGYQTNLEKLGLYG